MAHLEFNDYNILCAYPYKGSAPIFKWTYSLFEQFYKSAVTPSMYDHFSEFILEEISSEQLKSVMEGTYVPGPLEEDAITSYGNLPVLLKIDMHNETIRNLKKFLAKAERKKDADYTSSPFNEGDFLNRDYIDWRMSEKKKWEDLWEDTKQKIHEERQWRSCHEIEETFDYSGEF